MGPPNPEKWGPEGWGPEGWGPKFRSFFFPSPATISLFFSLSGCLLVEFWWCLKAGPEMCTFGVLGLSCETPAAPQPRRSRFGPKSAMTKGSQWMEAPDCPPASQTMQEMSWHSMDSSQLEKLSLEHQCLWLEESQNHDFRTRCIAQTTKYGGLANGVHNSCTRAGK